MQTILGPGEDGHPISADDVVEAYPWPESGPWVRAMMVTTLDGAAAGPDGLSGSISSAADQAVFNAVRRRADTVLIGSGTLRAEKYTPMRAKEADAEARAAAGQLPAPVLAVVSASLDLPWDLPVWSESTHRPLVLTAHTATPERRAEAERHAEVIELEATTPEVIVTALVDRGLRRIVCEGGPTLLNEFVRQERVDELDITVSPVIAGTAVSPVTPVLAGVAAFRLEGVLIEDDFLMGRYVARRTTPDGNADR